jgi:hypothetical protein
VIHTNLTEWYRTTFVLSYSHGLKPHEAEAMYPFELDIYVTLLQRQLEEEKKRRDEAAQGR